MSLPPGASSRDRWLDLADQARVKTQEALAAGDRRMAELWDEHERALLRNAYEDVQHPQTGMPDTMAAPIGTVGDLSGPLRSRNPFDELADDPDLASPPSIADGEGVQVADESALPSWVIARFAPIIAGAAGVKQWAQGLDKSGSRLRDPSAESRPGGSLSSPAEPMSPHEMQPPGFPGEPLDPREGNTETLPADPIVVKGTTFPIGEPNKGQIFIFPDLSDEIEQIGIVENRRGNDLTKAELDAIRDHLLKLNPGWKHFAGGRNAETGKQKEEYYIPNYFGGRKGANYTDLTFEGPDGELVHVQSVDVDKNGKPTQRELDIAERISKRTGQKVILIPKRWQTEK